MLIIFYLWLKCKTDYSFHGVRCEKCWTNCPTGEISRAFLVWTNLFEYRFFAYTFVFFRIENHNSVVSCFRNWNRKTQCEPYSYNIFMSAIKAKISSVFFLLCIYRLTRSIEKFVRQSQRNWYAARISIQSQNSFNQKYKCQMNHCCGRRSVGDDLIRSLSFLSKRYFIAGIYKIR